MLSQTQRSRSQASLRQQLNRRLSLVIVGLLSFVVVAISWRAFSNQTAQLRDDYTNGINRAVFNISSRLQPLIDAALQSATDERFVAFVEGSQALTTAVSQLAADLIRTYPEDILAINLLDTSGAVLFEMLNSNGQPQLVTQARLRARPGVPLEAAFFDALQSEGEVIIGQFLLARDPDTNRVIQPPRVSVSLYRPIRNSVNETIGVYRLKLDASGVLNIVNRAPLTFLDPVRDRHVVLTAGSSLILADSVADSRLYLNELEAASGNLAASGHSRVAVYLAERPRVELLMEWQGGEILTAAPVTLRNAVGPLLHVFIIDRWDVVYASSIATTALSSAGIFVTAVLVLLLQRRWIDQFLLPVEKAASTIAQVVDHEPEALTADALQDVVTRVVERIDQLDRDYTRQVERRNRELRVMGRIGSESTAQKDLDTLMQRSINLICNEMNFYHAQVFLIDRFENVARLAYSRGEAGQAMLAQRHSLEIGSASVIGAAAAERRMVIINDVDDPTNEFQHRFNPLLPETKAEMALPLIVGDELLGILDIQSRVKNVFMPDDLPTYELLANQLAVAMFNARLRLQTEERLAQIARLNRQLTRAVWSETAQDLQLGGTFGRLPEAPQVQVPIQVRGVEIGRLEAAVPNGRINENDRLLLQAIAERVALAIENVRLFEQTQATLAETATLYRLSQQLNEASTLDDIVRVVATTIVTDAADALLWLFDEETVGTPVHARLAADVNLTGHSTRQRTALQTILAMPSFLASIDSTEVNYIADVSTALLDLPLRALIQQMGTVTLIVIPLSMRGAWKGFVSVHFTHSRSLSERERRLFNALIAAAGVAVDNQTLLAKTEFERAYLTNILATLPAGVLVLDPITLVPVQVNARARELLPEADFTQPFSAEAYHLCLTASALPYPEDRLPIVIAQRTQQPAYVDDISYQFKDQHIDLLLNAAPVADAQYRVIAIVAAFQDITNLRKLESALQENLQETTVLYETQRVLAEAMSLDELLDAAVKQTSLREVDDVHIILIDEVTETLSLARYLVTPLDNLTLLRPLLSPTDEIIYDNLAAAELEPSLRALLQRVPMGCLMVAPLRSRTRSLPFGWILFSQRQPYGFDSDDVRFLTTLADMISTGVESIFLVLSTQAALQETAALYSASSTINRARDLQDLSEALRQALENLEPDVFAGYLIYGGQVRCLFNQGFEERLHSANLEQLIMLPIEEECMLVDDLAGAADLPILRALRRMDGLCSVAMVNLRIQEIVSGRLFLGFLQPHSFRPEDERYLNSISDSASVVVDNIALLEQVQETLQETSTLYQASRELTNARLPQEVLEIAVTHLTDEHVHAVMVVMLEQASWQSARLAVVEAVWNIESDPTLLPYDFTASQAIWPLLDTTEVTIYQDDRLTPAQTAELANFETMTLAVLPLRTPERVLGAVLILSDTPHVYNDRELRVLQSFAEQASLSLEAARLLKQTARRAAQLQATAEIAERVGQILDLDELLPQVVDLIRDRFDFDHVQIFLMDANDEYAVLRASTGEAGRELLARNHRLAKGSASVIGQVTASGRVIIAADTAEADVPHQPNPLLPNTRSEMALPLVLEGRVVGALDVQSNQPNTFTQDDVQTLSTLAAQISIAIGNARNYEAAQERAAEMAFLFDVTNAATSAETLQEGLTAILDRIEETLEPDVVIFFLLVRTVDRRRGEIFSLRAAGAKGLDIPTEAVEPLRLDDSDNLISITAAARQPLIINDISREVRYPAYRAASQSAILIPISSGADLLGLIVLESSRPNAFTSDTQTLLMALAGSLAAVLENTLLLEELQKTNERLREVDRLKSQFLANMSHELRTPLNSIIGFSRVMLRGIDGPLTEMQEQDLTTIYNSGNHLLNLINDILDQAKIEAKEMQLKLAKFDVKPMIESVKSIAVGLIKDKPLQLFVEVAPNLPPAYADEFRTRQILLNLMSNAIKFTPQGSVTLRVYQTTDDDDRTFIRADVIDTGIGISEEDMPILFEQFRQVDNSLTRTAGGTGLGLPISKALAELQGGQLFVTSQVGVGSTFSVLIPTQPTQEQAEPTLKPAPKTQEDADRTLTITTTQVAPRVDLPPMPSKREVLLIEDNKEMVDQLRRALQREGFDVVTADHPAYAEAMVGQLRPTMVLLDVNFAQGAGWQILSNLKSREDTSEIPIIVNTLSPERERALKAGADRYLQRPFMPDQLLRLVREVEAEFSRQRILLIDDQPESLRLLKKILTESGHYRVYVANNGQEGIMMVAQRRPDLVMLDLRMPEMDGFAVLNELRSNPETAKIPVVVVTGDVDLNASEREQLASVRILPKTQITNEQYNQLLNDIRNELRTL